MRVHAASGIVVPITGDPIYGDGVGPMLLHAAELTVPRDGKPPVHAASVPPDSFGLFQHVWTPRPEPIGG